jgi:hypothetical protein
MVKATMHKPGMDCDKSPGLERWEYGNPEHVAARRQAQSCRGCRHEETIHLISQSITYCGKGRKHGKRCLSYQYKEHDK